MPERNGRNNQRLRTRKDLLLAAARLLKQGLTPNMDDIAREALVSRATIYRYFPSLESLLVEAPLDEAVPDPAALFATHSALSAEDRIDFAENTLHEMTYQNQAQLRLMLAHSLIARHRDKRQTNNPIRQNRRTELIHAALAPVRKQMSAARYKALSAALAVFFGPEAMIVFEDVLQVPPNEARKVKRWAVRALVRSALTEHDTPKSNSAVC